MHGNFTAGSAIYLQIAQMLEDDILRGILCEEEQAPSTNEIAKQLQINPATAAKGLNLLVDEGILYKKRGIGMFVATGSTKAIQSKRKAVFHATYVKSMVQEAKSLAITKAELIEMIQTVQDEE